VDVVCDDIYKVWYWGGSSEDRGIDIDVDDSGNMYVAGITKSYGSGGYDVVYIKMDSNGNISFDKSWGGSDDDVVYDIKIDNSGNAYLFGGTKSYGGCTAGYNALGIKFSSNGNVSWNKALGQNTNCSEGYLWESVFLDTDNMYVAWQINNASFSTTNGGGFMKMTTLGNISIRKYVNDSSSYHWRAITTDGSYVYFLGWGNPNSATQPDLTIMKVDVSNNSVNWQKYWGGSDRENWESGTELSNRAYPSIHYGGDGYLYVVGFTKSFGFGGYDIAFLKYNTDGGIVLKRVWGGSGDEMGGIYNDENYVYIVGRTTSFSSGDNDGFLLKIDKSTGDLLLQKKWGCDGTDEAFYNVFAKGDYIYIVGYTNSGCTGNKWSDINASYSNISGDSNGNFSVFSSDVSFGEDTSSGNESSPSADTSGNAGNKDIVIMKIRKDGLDNL
jgi:hypothetical protein